jgi:hypothetical protein
MGMTLDPTLERLLNDLGFTWPMVDETELFDLGSAWLAFGGDVGAVHQGVRGAADDLLSVNVSEALEAFRAKFDDGEAPAAVLAQATAGVQFVGGALFACGGIVLALKINTIVNLIILAVQIAQAIATAPVTFGASLAEIPVFKAIMSRIINAIINEAVVAILA